jgi:nucleoside phosphorylase
MPDLLRETGAAHVILTGICYGLKEDDARDPQRLGDVLVATEVRAIGHFKTIEGQDGAPLRQERGGRPVASTVLVKLIREARLGWRNAALVHFGPMVSESVLCASREHRERIRQAEPQAIGGEMEGAAVFAAAERAGVSWAVVKAISDWGYDKDDRHQREAAENAASLVVRAIQLGGLSPVRRDR